MTNTNDNFIMLPTVDLCFKKLMDNEKVRRGFIAALLQTDPEQIRETIVLPTELQREYADDKLGILDVRVALKDGTQIDMEMQVAYFENWDARALFYLGKMFTEQLKKGDPYDNLKKCIHVSILDFVHFRDDEECYRKIVLCDEKTVKKYTDLLELQILELKKLSKRTEDEENVISWMRFLSGKSREEFEEMAKTDEYISEAYSSLKKLSADDIEKLQYEAREKAIRDYNSQMSSSLKRGIRQGIEQGIERGQTLEKVKLVLKKYQKGKSIEEIADELEEDISSIDRIYQMVRETPEETPEELLKKL